MTTLQEQFEKDFPDRGTEQIVTHRIYKNSNFTNRDLDLSGYVNLDFLNLACNELTNLNLTGLSKLKVLLLGENSLTSVDFLNTIPNPEKLVKNHIFGSYYAIECSSHGTNAKCKAIQDQLRPLNYDLEVWQLAHPEKMLISRPEYFTQPNSKEKWINALKIKLEESKQELSETDREKAKRITRLESKIQELEKAKSTISQQTQTEFSTQDKSTQADLTLEQIKQWEQRDKKTLYQKFIEEYGKK